MIGVYINSELLLQEANMDKYGKFNGEKLHPSLFLRQDDRAEEKQNFSKRAQQLAQAYKAGDETLIQYIENNFSFVTVELYRQLNDILGDENLFSVFAKVVESYNVVKQWLELEKQYLQQQVEEKADNQQAIIDRLKLICQQEILKDNKETLFEVFFRRDSANNISTHALLMHKFKVYDFCLTEFPLQVTFHSNIVFGNPPVINQSAADVYSGGFIFEDEHYYCAAKCCIKNSNAEAFKHWLSKLTPSRLSNFLSNHYEWPSNKDVKIKFYNLLRPGTALFQVVCEQIQKYPPAKIAQLQKLPFASQAFAPFVEAIAKANVEQDGSSGMSP